MSRRWLKNRPIVKNVLLRLLPKNHGRVVFEEPVPHKVESCFDEGGPQFIVKIIMDAGQHQKATGLETFRQIRNEAQKDFPVEVGQDDIKALALDKLQPAPNGNDDFLDSVSISRCRWSFQKFHRPGFPWKSSAAFNRSPIGG
jgi:hypothetical protein